MRSSIDAATDVPPKWATDRLIAMRTCSRYAASARLASATTPG